MERRRYVKKVGWGLQEELWGDGRQASRESEPMQLVEKVVDGMAVDGFWID